MLLLLCGVQVILGQDVAQNQSESAIEPRIVGGIKAKQGQFPHQISLRLRGEHYCGGVIISATHVITAGHCVKHGNDVLVLSKLFGSTLQDISAYIYLP